ncbi:unnamed protein product [Didymodactylos carnosus]|uniref:Uncharacterized protein n=1 Tax=Didymodactylos carnosus TaxID=1234261 RepID=A0A815X258_9BILA|nr:unnamed protein product [Didymodactylos carnosus]CAF4413151.1 unnamed protein product [Didymodactylos carnosus]
MNDDMFLTEWLDHNLNVVGFKNICLINVGQPISENITKNYKNKIVIINFNTTIKKQHFHLCLTCFTTIRPNDLLMIQDIDEFLNVRNSNYLQNNYDLYDQFHFNDLRFGYVYEKTNDLINKKLLETNVYRRPHKGLGEYDDGDVQRLFNCSVVGGWTSCGNGNGKQMIKYGLIQELTPHFHKSKNNRSKILYVDMKQIRLQHYFIRTKENGLIKGGKWNKLTLVNGVIERNNYFKLIYDNSILTSKRLI